MFRPTWGKKETPKEGGSPGNGAQSTWFSECAPVTKLQIGGVSLLGSPGSPSRIDDVNGHTE
jgi:hypothetical protein